MKMASSCCNYPTILLYVVFVSTAVAPMFIIRSAKADSAKDKEECAEKLNVVAACLPYVGGQTKAPTPDCCTGLKQVLNTDKRCLCLVIKDRNDPDLGLKINMTLAFRLPPLCKETDEVLPQCPALLHLDPKSPEAQAFFGQADQNTSSQNSPAPSPIGTEGSHPSVTNNGQSTGIAAGRIDPANNVATHNGLKWLHVDIVGCLLLSFFFFAIPYAY